VVAVPLLLSSGEVLVCCDQVARLQLDRLPFVVRSSNRSATPSTYINAFSRRKRQAFSEKSYFL
jgi:hypothetical protein